MGLFLIFKSCKQIFDWNLCCRFDPDVAIIQVSPNPGSLIIETRDILDIIRYVRR